MLRAFFRWRGSRRWDKKWRTPDRWRKVWKHDAAAPEVRASMEYGWLKPGMTILEVGCGSGENAVWLASEGCDVTAVDFSKLAIDRAVERFADTPNLSFAVVDVTGQSAHPADPYDAVLDRGCLHVLAPTLTRVYADNIRRWTKPSASFVLIMKLGRDVTDHERRQQVADLFSTNFALIDVRRVDMGGDRRREPLDGLMFHLRKFDREGEEKILTATMRR